MYILLKFSLQKQPSFLFLASHILALNVHTIIPSPIITHTHPCLASWQQYNKDGSMGWASVLNTYPPMSTIHSPLAVFITVPWTPGL